MKIGKTMNRQPTIDNPFTLECGCKVMVENGGMIAMCDLAHNLYNIQGKTHKTMNADERASLKPHFEAWTKYNESQEAWVHDLESRKTQVKHKPHHK